ncbi:PREDICTED: uncharacterized protein LOC109464943 [Branchiostoma belcheri]|uniref:Uncharacterized protein LOC109464943 n=1 Tax=Branchiostoma belcheri TaxID=7741 RepID=A0A6P4XLX7_BRABE|nr:PREDICTED: uncharacterized protein LOC109464943 [Branchiostoma belcheri]
METWHREILTRNRTKIVRDLRVADVINPLIERKIIMPRQKEELQQFRGEQQTAEFLDILVQRGPQAFPVFREVLRENHRHLADLLEDADGGRVQPVEPEAAIPERVGRRESSSDDSSEDEGWLPSWEQLTAYLGYMSAKDPTLVTALISLLTTVERALMICLVAIDVVNWVRSERCSLEGILRSIVLPLVLHPSHNFLLFPVLASWFIAGKLDHLRDLTKFIKRTKDALRAGQGGETTPEELRKKEERQRRYMKSVADALLLLIVLQTLAFSHAYYKHVYIGMEFRINILDEANVNGVLFCVGLFDVLVKVFVYGRYYRGRNPKKLLQRFDVRVH